MGKKHCRNKYEVLQRAWQQKQHGAGKPETTLKSRLQTINKIRQTMEKAIKMREGNTNASSSI